MRQPVQTLSEGSVQTDVLHNVSFSVGEGE